MFSTKIFSNNLDKEEAKEFVIVATPNGFLVTPKKVQSGNGRIILDYNQFYEDIFLTDEDSILKKINDCMLEKIGRKKVLSFIYAGDVKDEFNKIKTANLLINKDFDRE